MRKVRMYKEGEVEKDIFLKLSAGDNGVLLQAVNENGDRLYKGSIARINQDGTMLVFEGLDVEGLQVNGQGCILTKFQD